VRGVGGVDLSSVISKVTFQLHPSCEQPVVEQVSFPFETTQTGWGEFQAQLHISFTDPSVGKVVLSHHLQLFPDGQSTPAAKPVVKELYDELVFTGVSPDFQARLDALQLQPCPSNPLSSHWLTFSETADLAAIAKAHAIVKDQLAAAKEQIAQLDFNITKAKAAQASNAPDATTAAAAATSATPAVGVEAGGGSGDAMEVEAR